jgi:hypothetical protein
MRYISTGEPSTLGTYLKIAKFFGPQVEEYIQEAIKRSPNGEEEEVVAEESQVLYLFGHMMKKDIEPDELDAWMDRIGVRL